MLEARAALELEFKEQLEVLVLEFKVQLEAQVPQDYREALAALGWLEPREAAELEHKVAREFRVAQVQLG
jgi:hypothetical protein